LDALNKQEDTLQIHLYSQLERIDASIGEGFFYDITSTYLEGSQCVIAKLGYSRDHRPDREQIVIALMVTPQGSLFYWKVLAGNTQDITTIPGLAIHLTRLERVKAHVSPDLLTEKYDGDDASASWLYGFARGNLETNPILPIESCRL
jgi:hypothetical protein